MKKTKAKRASGLKAGRPKNKKQKTINAKPLPPDVFLLDAEQEHQKNPATFELAPLSERMNVRVGKHVKICFRFPNAPTRLKGERIWVRIETVVRPGVYIGFVDIPEEELLYPDVHGFHYKDRVQFEARHILMTKVPKTVPPGTTGNVGLVCFSCSKLDYGKT